MKPLKTAQFAEVRLLGEEFDENGNIPIAEGEENNGIKEHTIGIAVNLRFNENLGSAQKNVIGTPVPIFIPGYYQATISVEKATLDLYGWKTMVNINPYTAYLPNTYEVEERGLDYSGTEFSESGHLVETANKVPRFLFGLYVYDRIAQAGSRPTGMFLCMLQSYNSSITANDAVIMEDVTFLARPVDGSWFHVLRESYNLNSFFGYAPRILPKKNYATSAGGGGGGGTQTFTDQ